MLHSIDLALVQDSGVVADWVARIGQAIKVSSHRPQNLLVLVNPYGGARRALKIWERIAKPVFDRAGVIHASMS